MRKFLAPFLYQCLVLLVQGQQHSNPVGNWTLSNAVRNRSPNNETCEWQFLIAQSEAPANSSATLCQFIVNTTDGQDCGTASFSGLACNGTEKYSINGGHAPQGFIVLVLLDLEENAEAYFGFDDHALNSGAHIPEQIKSAHAPKASTITRSLPHYRRRVVESPLMGRDTNSSWTVKNMYRAVIPEDHRILIDMLILEGSPTGVVCQLELRVPEDTDAKTWGFSNAKCLGNDWTVHWGYLPANDAGVMTLVPPSRDSNAFFGYNDINSHEELGTAGPSQVLPCNCG